VFQDGGTFTPPIVSQFLHIYTVVSPIEIADRTHYRVEVLLLLLFFMGYIYLFIIASFNLVRFVIKLECLLVLLQSMLHSG
jgi:hypothetical protein